MSSSSRAFDAADVLNGIRRWVEIETPTDSPEQVNKLATLVADGYRDFPVTIQRIPGVDGRGDHLIARSAWGRGAPAYRLYQIR
jgi:glutamate carboxypeptidase